MNGPPRLPYVRDPWNSPVDPGWLPGDALPPPRMRLWHIIAGVALVVAAVWVWVR